MFAGKRGGGGGVTMFPRVITNRAPWGGKVTGPSRQSPVTSNALLTPVWKERHHNPPPTHNKPNNNCWAETEHESSEASLNVGFSEFRQSQHVPPAVRTEGDVLQRQLLFKQPLIRQFMFNLFKTYSQNKEAYSCWWMKVKPLIIRLNVLWVF